MLGKNIYSPHRASQPLQKKLRYIRNDSSPEGDNFGAWYHFVGAALYGLKRSAWISRAVVLTEAAGSYLLEGPDRQETLINVAGARFGHNLKRVVGKGQWRDPLPADADLRYMNLHELKSTGTQRPAKKSANRH